MGKGMKAGKRPSSKPSRQDQMAQLAAMQSKMEAMQAEIEQTETEASAGGGAITVKVNGAHQLTSVRIDPKIIDPDDVEMLEDLIVAATNEAMRQIDELSQSRMNSLTSGLGLPPGIM
ncbi:MAG: YbaB/EbfC family nucleoid-associated protein [Firmicutes bacterium]|nr:YbaB/EbfC family nucleoid-associated protein [Bacillota bacterium]